MPSKSSSSLVAANVLRLRVALGMSQAVLAKKMGVAQPRISEIEHGTTDCTGSTLDRLADALGVSQAELFAEKQVAARRVRAGA